MSMIADKIEKFILDRMREEQEKLILKRCRSIIISIITI